MIYRLIILNGDRHGEQITLTQEPMIIGRAETSEIRLNDPEIALSHAEIAHSAEGLYIRDLGSMNRLLINNREVHEARPKHGDVIEVGHTRFLIQAYVQAEVPGKIDEDGEEGASRLKPWLIGGGLLMLLVFMFIFIPRCERMMIAPRTPITKLNSSPNFPPVTHTTIKRPTPPPTAAVAPTQTPIAATQPIIPPPVTPPPTPKQAPITVPTPPHVEPLALKAEQVPVQEEPAPVKTEPVATQPPPQPEQKKNIETPPSPRRNLTSELIAASQRELQEATLILLGPKTNNPDIVINTSSNPSAPVEATPPPTQTETAGNVAPVAIAPTILPTNSTIKITNTEINKFPETEQFREMRLLTIRLTATNLQKELEPEGVSVEVIFVDRDKKSGQIFPTSSRGPAGALTVQGKWLANEQKTLLASYVVPASLSPSERSVQYYGFILRVFYFGTLQDEVCQPQSLPQEISVANSNNVIQASAP